MSFFEEDYKMFDKLFDELKREEEEFWATLSPEQQLLVFCAVVRRLNKGELQEQRSYRGILYDVFGFGPESYARAQHAGFLALHNSIEVDDKK